VANWNNSRPWIGFFQGAKCGNVSKFNLEFDGNASLSLFLPFSPFHILISVPVAAPILFSFLLIVWLRVTDTRQHRSAVYVGMVVVVCII